MWSWIETILIWLFWLTLVSIASERSVIEISYDHRIFYCWIILFFKCFRRSRIKNEKRMLTVRIYFVSRGTWGGAWNCSPPRWTLSIRDALYQSVQLPPWAPVTALIPSQVSHVLTFVNPKWLRVGTLLAVCSLIVS